jgi:hypothetical protein
MTELDAVIGQEGVYFARSGFDQAAQDAAATVRSDCVCSLA